jgi:hypothetical protein
MLMAMTFVSKVSEILRSLYQISLATLEKLGHALFDCLVTGVVIKFGFVGGLHTNANDCRGVVINCLVVERETSQGYEFGAMVGFVLDSISEDAREGVNPNQLVVGDDREQ